MAAKPLPDQSYLLKMVRYDADSGRLFYNRRAATDFPNAKYPQAIANAFNTRFGDKEATGSLDTYGYVQVTIAGRLFLAHRLIWKLVTGEDPEEIDHINGIRFDNRWCNLRPVSHRQNSQNRKRNCRNKSGMSGVIKRENGKWRARINVDGRELNLGTFCTKAEAILARRSAERRFGYHPNHGRVLSHERKRA